MIRNPSSLIKLVTLGLALILDKDFKGDENVAFEYVTGNLTSNKDLFLTTLMSCPHGDKYSIKMVGNICNKRDFTVDSIMRVS